MVTVAGTAKESSWRSSLNAIVMGEPGHLRIIATVSSTTVDHSPERSYVTLSWWER